MMKKSEKITAGGILILLVLSAIYLIFSMENTDKAPVDYARWQQEKDALEEELKNLKLPAQTKISEFEDQSRRATKIFLTSTIETNLEKTDFFSQIDRELKNKDWKPYQKKDEGSFLTYKYCREAYQLFLSDQKQIELISKGPDIWKLIYIFDFEKFNYDDENKAKIGCYTEN